MTRKSQPLSGDGLQSLEGGSSEALLLRGRLNPSWLTVLAGFVGMVFGPSTMIIMCFGVFVDPLRRQFGWTLGQTALAATIVTIVLVPVSPLQGYLVDRFGGRRIVIVSIPLFAAAYGSLYFLPDSLGAFYAFWLLITVCATGLWPLSYLRSTASWFDHRLGFALGVTNSGVGVGNVIIPAMAGWLLSEYGWRLTYLILAATALLVTWPLSLIWLRDRVPQALVAAGGGGRQAIGCGVKWRSETFATIAVVFFLMGAASSGLLVMQVPMLRAAGIGPLAAAGIASVGGMAMIIGRLATGYLLDLLHASRVLGSLILASSIGAILYALGITAADAPVAAILIGLAIGAEFDGLSYVLPRYFPRSAFGKLYGAVFAIFQLGSGAGIGVIGLSHDALGSFKPSMWVLSAAMVVAGLVVARLGPYRYGSVGAARDDGQRVQGQTADSPKAMPE